MIARIFKFFVLMPVVAAVVIWHLATSNDWAITLLLGIALYFPIHQLGQSAGHHKLFAHRAFNSVRWYPPVATLIASVSFLATLWARLWRTACTTNTLIPTAILIARFTGDFTLTWDGFSSGNRLFVTPQLCLT